MKGAAAVALAGLLLSSGSAHAYLKAGPVGYGHWLQATATQQGMTTSLAAAYSFRKVRDAYAGSAMQLRRVDNSALANIGFTAGGDFDTAAATAHCAGTSCTVATWYDQSGAARNLTNPAASQLDYVAVCIGDKPCARTTGARHLVGASPVTPSAVAQTLSVVARVDAAEQSCVYMNAGKQQLISVVPGAWQVWNTALAVNAVAPSGAFHAGIGVVAGASSVLRIDGAETAGSVPVVTTSDNLYVAYGSGGANPCSISEAIWWDGYALTASERLALANNQKDYWTPLPLDNFATAGAYSMRRLRSAYTGPAIRLRRALDSVEADIGFLGFTSFTGAPIDTAAANSHCAGTTCTVAIWYDQSGNARHATAGLGNQPEFIFNCLGTLPCARSDSNNDIMQSASVTWVSAKSSLSAVGQRTAGTAACVYIGKNVNWLVGGTANTWQVMDNTTGSFTAAATDNVWHAGVGVIDGASSVLRIDGAETTGTLAGTAAAGVVYLAYGAAVGTTCNYTEALLWDNYALTANERAALRANQQSFWGTP